MLAWPGLTAEDVVGRVAAEATADEHQLRALRRRIERTTRNARGYRRYDEELRVEIVEYVLRRKDDGCCQAEVARELGLT